MENISFMNLVLMISLMPATFSIDIPVEKLSSKSNFHCYEHYLCVHPLEYCNSDDKTCRPCSRELCALAETKIPLQCKQNCTIEDYVAKEKAKNFVERHPYVWFILSITFFAVGIPVTVIVTMKRATLTQSIRRLCSVFVVKNKINKTDEEQPLCQNMTEKSNNKETQTECPPQETKECQTVVSSSYDSLVCCEKKVKNTTATNEGDSKVALTSATEKKWFSQRLAPKPSKISPTSVAGNCEQGPDQTRSKLDQVPTPGEQDSRLTSAILHQAPTLDPSTFHRDEPYCSG